MTLKEKLVKKISCICDNCGDTTKTDVKVYTETNVREAIQELKLRFCLGNAKVFNTEIACGQALKKTIKQCKDCKTIDEVFGVEK